MMRSILIACLLAGSFAAPAAHAETARVLPADPVHPFANVAALSGNAAKRLKDGDLAQTAGYTTAGDGGGAVYRYATTGRPTEDGVLYHDGPGADDFYTLLHGGQINARQAGCTGDGSTDDATQFAAWMAACSATGAKAVGLPSDVYHLESDVSIDRTGGEPLEIDFAGATVDLDEARLAFEMWDSGTSADPFLTTSFASDPARGDTHLELSSVSGVQKGDQIRVVSPALSSGSTATEHIYVVNEVSGSDVYIVGTVLADINDAQVSGSGQTGDIDVEVYRPAPSIAIRRGLFSVTDADGDSGALYIHNHSDVDVSECRFNGNTRYHLNIQYCSFATVDRCRFRDFGYMSTDADNPTGSAPDSSCFGYGCGVYRVYEAKITNSVGEFGWHVIDFGRGVMHGTADGLRAYRNRQALGTHESAWDIVFRNCDVQGQYGGTVGRAAYVTVENCKFRDMQVHALVISQQMMEFRMRGCTFDIRHGSSGEFLYFTPNTDADPENGIQSSGYRQVFELTGNSFEGAGIIYGPLGANSSGDCIVKANAFAEDAQLNLYGAVNTVVEGNTFTGTYTQIAALINDIQSDNKIVVANNTDTAARSGGFTQFMQLNGADGSGSTIFGLNNFTVANYLFRIGNSLTVKVLANNHSEGRLTTNNSGTPVITDAINNSHVTATPYENTTVTNNNGTIDR